MPSPKIASGPSRPLGLVTSSVAARNTAAQVDAERMAQLPQRPIADVAPRKPRQSASPPLQIQATDPLAQAREVTAILEKIENFKASLALLQRQADRRVVNREKANAQIESIAGRRLVLQAFLEGKGTVTDQQGLPMTRESASSEIAKLVREEQLASKILRDLQDDEADDADHKSAFVAEIARLESVVAAQKTVVTIANQRRS